MLIGNRYGWHLDYSLTEKFWNCRMLAGLSFEKGICKKDFGIRFVLKGSYPYPYPFPDVWLRLFFLPVLSPQAFGVNSIALGDNSKAYGDNSKGYGDRIDAYKKV